MRLFQQPASLRLEGAHERHQILFFLLCQFCANDQFVAVGAAVEPGDAKARFLRAAALSLVEMLLRPGTDG
jgi:hypothetical protein